MYRPEGWEKNKKLDCAKCAFIDSKPSSDCWFCSQNYEAGADAYAQALIKKGIHYEAGVILDPGLIQEIVRSGTLVFIPDEECK